MTKKERIYQFKDLGDGKPVKVYACTMCGVCPSNVDDCGQFGNPYCPCFGVKAGEEKCT